MKLENQVVSWKIAKRLKELEVKQYDNSLFYWVLAAYAGSPKQGDTISYLIYGRPISEQYEVDNACAYTVAELGELLPDGYATTLIKGKYFMGSIKLDHKWATTGIMTDTEANARGKMLIYLLENNLIKLGK